MSLRGRCTSVLVLGVILVQFVPQIMAWYVQTDHTWLKLHSARRMSAEWEVVFSLTCIYRYIHGRGVGKGGVWGKMMGGDAQGETYSVVCMKTAGKSLVCFEVNFFCLHLKSRCISDCMIFAYLGGKYHQLVSLICTILKTTFTLVRIFMPRFLFLEVHACYTVDFVCYISSSIKLCFEWCRITTLYLSVWWHIVRMHIYFLKKFRFLFCRSVQWLIYPFLLL